LRESNCGGGEDTKAHKFSKPTGAHPIGQKSIADRGLSFFEQPDLMWDWMAEIPRSYTCMMSPA
jgi:hypothetical protein